jgi:hypothetical protein
MRIESDLVVMAQPPDMCRSRGVQSGTARETAVNMLGAPTETCWLYSRSPGGDYYRLRAVCFERDRVAATIRRWAKD